MGKAGHAIGFFFYPKSGKEVSLWGKEGRAGNDPVCVDRPAMRRDDDRSNALSGRLLQHRYGLFQVFCTVINPGQDVHMNIYDVSHTIFTPQNDS